MAFTLGILILVFGITISIALHEFGHLVPAKLFGVRVPKYVVGFGPTLWSRKRGDTEYEIKPFPLWGYVRLMGMVPPADEVKPVKGTGRIARMIEETRAAAVQEIEPGNEARAFYRLPWPKRVVVMAGGTFMNLFLVVLIFTGIGVFYGAEVTVPTVAGVVECAAPTGEDGECLAADPPTAASLAGFEVGDTIVAVDGMEVDDWDALVAYIKDHAGIQVAFTVDRDGDEVALSAAPTLEARPVYDDDGNSMVDRDGQVVTTEVGFLGVQPTLTVEKQGIGYGSALTVEYLGLTAEIMAHLPEQLWHAGRAAFGLEERDPNGIIGFVGAGRIAGEIAAVDNPEVTMGDQIAAMFALVGSVNLALFVFNLIPLTPLDGGHVAGALWQGVKNGWARLRKAPRPRPVDLARMMPLAYAVVILFALMAGLLLYADIVAPVSLG
jgi:membrane-associated protease RseP (regulator of RpoE activity)